MSTHKLKLSASRIKTYENCSWLYYCNYILKLPQSSNDGSNRGDTVHRVLECLAKPHRANKVKSLLGDMYSVPSVNRMIQIIADKNGVGDELNVTTIYKFIHVALKNDFYCEGGELKAPEYEFAIGDPVLDGYHAVGFIDKYAVFEKEKFISIRDYKTSKTAFSLTELEDNVQALMYALAMRKKYPEYNSEVRFEFLKFPKNPIRKISFTANQLKGFEEYLKSVYSTLKGFDYSAAQMGYAAKGGYSKAWLCGKASYPGEQKDDGSLMWCCPYKFSFIYYAVVDDFGNNIRTSKTVADLRPKTGEIVMKKHYKGCKYWEKILKFE